MALTLVFSTAVVRAEAEKAAREYLLTSTVRYLTCDEEAVAARYGSEGHALLESLCESGYFCYLQGQNYQVVIETDSRDCQWVFVDANAAREWLLTQLV